MTKIKQQTWKNTDALIQELTFSSQLEESTYRSESTDLSRREVSTTKLGFSEEKGKGKTIQQTTKSTSRCVLQQEEEGKTIQGFNDGEKKKKEDSSLTNKLGVLFLSSWMDKTEN